MNTTPPIFRVEVFSRVCFRCIYVYIHACTCAHYQCGVRTFLHNVGLINCLEILSLMRCNTGGRDLLHGICMLVLIATLQSKLPTPSLLLLCSLLAVSVSMLRVQVVPRRAVQASWTGKPPKLFSQ